ncbi:MAG: dihydroneopterin aldolase [Candidatus Cloacimonetes bacterium]|nr:dihydroneopterin aldolase [Candidatus Cloacimonadota bacterium]
MKVHLKELIFYGFHGVAPEERKLGQRFVVNFTFETKQEHDKDIATLSDTIDYTKVYEIIRHIIEEHTFHLLENCANMILNDVMTGFPKIIFANVKIKKPSVPIKGTLEAVELEMERTR